MNFASGYANIKNALFGKKPCQKKMDIAQPSMRMGGLIEKLSESDEEMDANVVSIKFNTLKTMELEASNNLPVSCRSCTAAINVYSRILKKQEYEERKALLLNLALKNPQGNMEEEKKEEGVPPGYEDEVLNADVIQQKYIEISQGKQAWICEFCGVHNEVEGNIMPEIINDKTYFVDQLAKTKFDETDKTSLIFCMDISGSMSTTQEIEGNFEFSHGLTEEEYNMLKQFMDPHDSQLLPTHKANKTHVSRKQCVVAAMEQEIKRLAEEKPEMKVGLVTFNSSVTIVGDAGTSNIPIEGALLDNFDDLYLLAQNIHTSKMGLPINKSISKLNDTLKKLREGGQTALGPAVVAALGLASRGSAGSKIVICTDGLANIGLGALHENIEKASEFYEKLGLLAKDMGITISVVTIKGEGCSINSLSKLTSTTNGAIKMVDPANLSKDFANVLKDEILGTQCSLKFRLHRGFKFRNEQEANLKENGSLLEREIGNITSKLELMFEYAPKTKEELDNQGIDLLKKKMVPFQCQIIYANTKGNRMVRICTHQQKITHEDEVANKNLNIGLLAARGQQVQAMHARKKSFENCEKEGKKWNKFLVVNSRNVDSVEKLRDNEKKVNKFCQKNMSLQVANKGIQQRDIKKMEKKKFLEEQSSKCESKSKIKIPVVEEKEQCYSDIDNLEVEDNIHIGSDDFLEEQKKHLTNKQINIISFEIKYN